MQTDYLLIGQGICGTFLSWYLQKAGLRCLVMDEQQNNSASVTAAGIINPVTGRRIVKTWLIEEVMPFAKEAYEVLGKELQITAIEQKNSIDFFPSAQMRHAFLDRYAADTEFLSLPQDENDWRKYFNYDLGYGIIDPCYLVNLPELLPAYRNYLKSRNELLEQKFDHQLLKFSPEGIEYDSISAQAIIFCDGISSTSNPWFQNLPFAPNKGEMLLINAPEIPSTHIFKRGMNLVPWKENIFWIGSSYEWEFENDQPTAVFRERTEAVLRHWLKSPFTIIDHRAALRPATLERRPFAGFHPQYASLGIFNGMGTKGCSLAPYFASQLVRHIQNKTALHPEADVKRFQRVLLRNMK
jgi:glycine/D-amino acid oxidase-like deaminating enzyme